jgi:uncharacterized membrane protein YphA (DoxX/SURF4 family)
MLLRAVLGITLEVQGVDSLMNWHDLTLITQAIGLLAIASGALLLIGFFTPFASVLGGLICVASKLLWLRASSLNLFQTKLSTALAVSIAIAIICLGPGAFSIDARLFGRREIIIPDASHPGNS